MDEIGGKLRHVKPLNVKPWNASSLVAPAAMLKLPDHLDYQVHYGGDSRAFSGTFELHVVVGKLYDKGARDKLSRYLDTAGPSSVFAALDSNNSNTYTTCHVLTVDSIDVASLEDAGVDYLDAVFTLSFVGRGLTT